MASKPSSNPGSLRRRAACVLVGLALALCGVATAQTVTVFAAASLTESFRRIAARFERLNPGVSVALSFAGSSTLSLQVIEGAPVDVFASADVRQMQRVAAAGLIGGSRVFATNRLVVVAARGAGLRSFADLAEPGVKLVLAGPEVPAGRYAREAVASYDAAVGGGFADRVMANLVSEEQNVRLVAAKVELGEADAGIVYATDAAAFEGLVTIELPEGHEPVAEYVIAALRGAPRPELAAAFVAFVASEAGRRILEGHGFGTPAR